MTDSSTTRLDRLEALAETIMIGIQQNQRQIEQNSRLVEQNNRQIEQNSRLVEQNSRQIEQNSRLVEQNSRDIKESMVEVVDMLATLGQQIEENSVYIRGLQAENRNILSLLMEQIRKDDDNDSNGNDSDV